METIKEQQQKKTNVFYFILRLLYLALLTPFRFFSIIGNIGFGDIYFLTHSSECCFNIHIAIEFNINETEAQL